MNTPPETPFQIVEDGSLVYCLRFSGSYRKGNPITENDVAVGITIHRDRPREDMAEVAKVILDALNAHFKPTEP